MQTLARAQARVCVYLCERTIMCVCERERECVCEKRERVCVWEREEGRPDALDRFDDLVLSLLLRLLDAVPRIPTAFERK